MVCLNTQFHIPDSSTSLITAIKSKAEKILTVATTLFYISQEYYIKKAYYLSTYSMLKLLH